MKNKLLLLIVLSAIISSCSSDKIDRKAVVNRHNVHITEADSLNSLTVGNGRFAMTVDITGLQSFPDFYENGVPLGTQSEWGWHSFPSDEAYDISETDELINSHGRQVPYARQWPRNTRAGQAANYLRQNPHRVHLAQLGWEFIKTDGSIAIISDLKETDQTLDLWNGEITSKFELEGEAIEVTTLAAQNSDKVAVKIKSSLLEEGRIRLKLNLPTAGTQWRNNGNYYDGNEAERITLNAKGKNALSIHRVVDNLSYFIDYNSSVAIEDAAIHEKGVHLQPASESTEWSFSCNFSEVESAIEALSFDEVKTQSERDWHQFWNAGGIIDFGNVNDPRAKEIERRMLLSMYLTKTNCGGKTPPQETGLTYNSWYGKPHMEMTWWHGVHFGLWGRTEILEDHADWYLRNMDGAKSMAIRQDFEGIRWQKMTDPWGGETSSSIGSYLVWQQPHIIYFAEMIYGQNSSTETLEKYADVIEQTAEFMADYAYFEPELKRYILGTGIIPAQERFDPATTFNPTYELAYWRWGLEKAQIWRERMGEPRNEKWDNVLADLSPLPVKDGLYLASESTPDSYTTEHFMTDHPSVLGTFGMLPETEGFDKEVMQATFDKIWTDWAWADTWGWDFPMTAMTATRLGQPEKAVDALLMPIITNTFLANGHNYQNETLTIYLPGNGGLLTALALMATGTEDVKSGFPTDWDVKWEGLEKML